MAVAAATAAAAPDATEAETVDPAPRPNCVASGCHSGRSDHRSPRRGRGISRFHQWRCGIIRATRFSPANLLLLLNLMRNPRIRISDRLEESLNESVPKFVSRW